MAAHIGDGFTEKLTCLRRLLCNSVTDNNIIAEIYTEHDMSVIRDLTSYLKITDNRHVLIVL